MATAGIQITAELESDRYKSMARALYRLIKHDVIPKPAEHVEFFANFRVEAAKIEPAFMSSILDMAITAIGLRRSGDDNDMETEVPPTLAKVEALMNEFDMMLQQWYRRFPAQG